MGRPSTVPGSEITSVVLGKQERRILAAHQRLALQSNDTKGRSSLIRTIIRSSTTPEAKDRLEATFILEAEKRDLQRRLQAAQEKADAAERNAAQAELKAKASQSIMARLLQHLPLVRDRAASKNPLPSGIRELDQIWHNAGRSWARVQARLEDIQRKRLSAASDGPPPPAGGSAATDMHPPGSAAPGARENPGGRKEGADC